MLKSLVCLLSIVSLWISPSFGTDQSEDIYYSFNGTVPINNASIVLIPFSNAPQLISWAFGADTTNATFVEVYSAIVIGGTQEYQNSESKVSSNRTGGVPIVSNSRTMDPCVTYVAKNQSVSFVITEARTDADSGTLAQYLNVQPLPIVSTNSSTTVSFVPACNRFGSSDEFEYCSANSYFGLNTTSATTNRTIVITISLSNGAMITDKINRVILAGDGSCANSYSDDDINVNWFQFPLSRVNGSTATFQASVRPLLNGLWYLFLDYSRPITRSDVDVTVSLTVNPQYQPQPPHHGSDDDSDSDSMSDDDGSGSDDSHMGRKIAGIIIAIIIGLLILAAVAVYVIRKRRANFDQLE